MDEPETDRPVAVIVPAAGRGSRLGGKRKQFRRLGDAPVVVQTVRRFFAHPRVEIIAISTGADLISHVEEWLAGAGLDGGCRIVTGGSTRQASVAAGLAALPSGIETVIVHDAVRPFVVPRMIDEVIAGAESVGAAAVAVPVADTLRRVRDGSFGETVDRRDLYRMQTPQGFRRDWLVEAHRRALRDDVQETDDVALVQRQDRPVKVVQGSICNMKITTSEDWELAQLLWSRREQT